MTPVLTMQCGRRALGRIVPQDLRGDVATKPDEVFGAALLKKDVWLETIQAPQGAASKGKPASKPAPTSSSSSGSAAASAPPSGGGGGGGCCVLQ
jgi:hypothetical protein